MAKMAKEDKEDSAGKAKSEGNDKANAGEEEDKQDSAGKAKSEGDGNGKAKSEGNGNCNGEGSDERSDGGDLVQVEVMEKVQAEVIHKWSDDQGQAERETIILDFNKHSGRWKPGVLPVETSIDHESWPRVEVQTIDNGHCPRTMVQRSNVHHEVPDGIMNSASLPFCDRCGIPSRPGPGMACHFCSDCSFGRNSLAAASHQLAVAAEAAEVAAEAAPVGCDIITEKMVDADGNVYDTCTKYEELVRSLRTSDEAGCNVNEASEDAKTRRVMRRVTRQ